MALIDEEHVPLEINDTTGEVRLRHSSNFRKLILNECNS